MKRNILLIIETVLLLVMCFTWCFSLQHNFDVLLEQNHKLNSQLSELKVNTEREIRLLKTDLQIKKEGWK